MKISSIFKIGGIGIGVIALISLVSLHPIHISVIGIGALIYFVGAYFKRKGK